MTPILLAGPAVEPVTLAATKAYLRLDTADEDELVAALIVAGRLTVERTTRLALLAQQLRCVAGRWPDDRALPLPPAPVMSVDAVRVSTAAGGFAILDPGLYRLDAGADPARLLVDAAAPDPVGKAPAIQVDLTCGFGTGAAAVPAPLALAVQRLAAWWFESRGDEPQAPTRGLPADVAALLAPYRRARLA